MFLGKAQLASEKRGAGEGWFEFRGKRPYFELANTVISANREA
jgi:hypothetical protein